MIASLGTGRKYYRRIISDFKVHETGNYWFSVVVESVNCESDYGTADDNKLQ
jgi:hypothetical protein